jgi:hypothetical protein
VKVFRDYGAPLELAARDPQLAILYTTVVVTLVFIARRNSMRQAPLSKMPRLAHEATRAWIFCCILIAAGNISGWKGSILNYLWTRKT